MLPPIVTIVPLFLMLREARLLNSLLGLAIVYTAFNLPFVVWMMRGFFEEVPREIEEAAMLDGESRLGALLRIVLPLVKPGLAATAVFCLIVAWNEFLFALILTQTEAAMTLAGGHRVASHAIRDQVGRDERRRRGRHAAGAGVRRRRAKISGARIVARRGEGMTSRA